MFVRFDQSAHRLRKYLPDFVSLIGDLAWRKRLTQLLQNLKHSPAFAHVVLHYDWLELALHEQLAISEKNFSDHEQASVPESLSALHFAQTVVEVHARLSTSGQIALGGRLRDSLKAESGLHHSTWRSILQDDCSTLGSKSSLPIWRGWQDMISDLGKALQPANWSARASRQKQADKFIEKTFIALSMLSNRKSLTAPG
jgi:hypothetical protein